MSQHKGIRWIDDPKFEFHPYYAEWKHDFLVKGCMEGGQADQEFLDSVRAWLRANMREPCYMVGQRVSMNNDADAVAFMLHWG